MSDQNMSAKVMTAGIDKLNAFTEELHEWSKGGKKPLLASKELRYVLDRQRERLDSKGISVEEKVDHTGDEITGRLVRKGEGISASIVYREAVRHKTVRSGERVLRKEKEPIIFYATLLEKPGTKDFSCTCPNCGHTELFSKMQNGCPYCGTVFEIEEVWPIFSSWYSVPGIVERATLMQNLKKYLSIVFAAAFALLTVITWFVQKDMDPLPRVPVSIFTGAVTGGMVTFLAYMLYSFRLLGKTFKEAGRAIPLLKGIKTKNKVEEVVRQYEPDFSYSYFEGRFISLLRAIAFTDDRKDLSIYEGNEDLSFFDNIIDMQYRGSIQLLSSQVSDGVIKLKLRAFMDDLRFDGRLRRKDETYIVSIEKDIDAKTDPGFDLCSVECKSCGASFDALHMKTCPYCNTPYRLVHDDWMITSIEKG